MQTIPQFEQLNTQIQDRLNLALTNLLHKEISLEVGKCVILPIIEVHDDILNQTETYVMAVYIPIIGDVTGDVFTILPVQSANTVADLMIGNPLGTTNYIGEFETSALKEMGNIATGVIVTEIANMLSISMMLTIPNLANDMAGALIDQVLIEYGANSNDLLAIEFPFKVKDLDINGNFLMLFDQHSSEAITQKLESLNK